MSSLHSNTEDVDLQITKSEMYIYMVQLKSKLTLECRDSHTNTNFFGVMHQNSQLNHM